MTQESFIRLDGKTTATEIKKEIAKEVQQMVAAGQRPPCLGAIIVGHDGASETYIASKIKACEEVGFISLTKRFDESITQEELIAEIEQLNKDPEVDGFIVQLPLPKHIDEQAVIHAVDYRKDVDGFHPINVGLLSLGEPCLVPATPKGVIELLKHYNISTEGKHVVVLGRSNIVGKPIAQLFLQKGAQGNATVTICHSRTKDIASICRQADIVVAAIGIPLFVKKEMVKEGAIVIDVGGTTTDLGVLSHGFPRESGVAVTIGGVRTNFRMPDLVSVGLGGGSLVRQLEDGSVTVGPDSVGYLVTKKARCFGGDTLTATDIVVAKGLAEGVGDPTLVADLEPALVDAAYAEITRIIEDAVDAMKTSAGDVTVILVGGGSILAPDQLEGSDNVLRPENFGVANAVGSAIAQVSGQIAKVFSLTETPREQALAESKQRACDEAIEAGADPSTVEVVDVEDIPMAYLGDALCIRVKAVGDLML